jgi:predicted metal-dependent hydrolase
MSYADNIKRILEEYKLKLEVSDEVKVRVRNYKTRAAFTNLQTRVIYINKNLLDVGEEVLRYLILHELIHIKLNNKYHDETFYKILYNYVTPEEIGVFRKVINEKLINTNHLRE